MCYESWTRLSCSVFVAWPESISTKKQKSPNSVFQSRSEEFASTFTSHCLLKVKPRRTFLWVSVRFLSKTPSLQCWANRGGGRAVLELSITHCIILFTCPWNLKPHRTNEMPTMGWNELLVKPVSWTLNKKSSNGGPERLIRQAVLSLSLKRGDE